MKQWWKEFRQFFHFYPNEKKALFALFTIVFLLLVGQYLFRNYFYSEEEFSLSDTIHVFREKNYDSKPCLNFNADSIGIDDKLLVSKIIKERKKYGNFNCIEDLRDVKGLKSQDFESFLPYIQEGFYNCSSINLNSANQEELKKFFRINTKSAKTIINYRSFLGGFAQKEQLLSAYHFPKSRLNIYRKKRINLNRNKIKKLSIKNSKYKLLSKHPLISKKEAWEITQKVKNGLKIEFQEIFAKSKHKSYIHYYLSDD